MKNKLRCFTAVGSALLIGCVTVQAQYQWNPPNQPAPYSQAGRFYVNADVGGSLEQSLSIKNLGERVGFDPGTRGDISFGYNVMDSLAFEFETGVIWNSTSGSDSHIISPAADHADLYQVPILGNIIFKAPFKNGITPYIGAGAGGVASTLTLTHDPSFSSFGAHTSDTDFTFAYQGMAGLKFALGWNMELGVGYKFLGTLDHRWFGDQSDLYIHTSPTLSHSILATFTWRF